MATLDLFSNRPFHTIVLNVDGKPKKYKIPSDYTVMEIERLLEGQRKIEEAGAQEVTTDDEATKQRKIEEFVDTVRAQLLVLFGHFHPEVDMEFLKKFVTLDQALEILKFHFQNKVLEEKTPEGKTKKKVRSKR